MLALNWLRSLQLNSRVRTPFARRSQSTRRKVARDVGREVEALESRVCLTVFYDYDVIAQSGQDGLASILSSSTTINDDGTVAFVGQLSNGQSIYVKESDSPLTNITPGFVSSGRTFRAGIQINNSGLVGAVDRVAGGTVGTVARIWDSANPDAFIKIAQAASPRNPQTQADFFTILQSFASLSNEGQLAFAGQETPLDFLGNPTGAPDFNEIHLSNSLVDRRDLFSSLTEVTEFDSPAFFRFMAADGDRVVVGLRKDGVSSIVRYDLTGIDTALTVASTGTGGWTSLGVSAGISDDGKAIAFYGENEDGPGLFIAVDTGLLTGTVISRIAGVSRNGNLDPLEHWIDSNSNHVVDAGEDHGLFASFSIDTRIGIEHSLGASGLDLYSVAFLATNESGDLGLFTAQVDAQDANNVSTFSPLNIASIGAQIDGISGTIQDISLYDPINNQGAVVFGVNTGSTQAVIRFELKDTDEDGLYDIWETSGIDLNGDGVIDYDLPALGANPLHKDLFVEVDAMVDRAPLATTLDAVVNAFASAPNALVSNPDGLDGINLHVMLDEQDIPLTDFPNGFAEFQPLKAAHFGSIEDRNSLNSDWIILAKQLVNRYAMFANQYGNTSSSGLAEVGGNDFMVTLGGWSRPGGTIEQQAGTFMHELGHTLGLLHGGGDSVNDKPNYISVMNYLWQTPMGRAGWSLRSIDYSREELPALFESTLFEASGIGGRSGAVTVVGPRGSRHDVSESGAADFNGINGKAETLIDFDLNGDDEIGILAGHEDWSKLKYDFRKSPGYANGYVQPLDPNDSELTLEDYEALLAIVEGDNDAPNADAGGPYTVAWNGSIELDASGSNDPDEPSNGLIYEWDLDGDSIFGETGANATRGDEIGIRPTFLAQGLPASSTFAASLQVTDDGGLTSFIQAVIQIAGEPPGVVLLVSTETLTESGGSVSLMVTLSTISLFDVTVTLGFSGTAALGTDYTATQTQVVIPAGMTDGTVTLTAVPDTVYEPNETVVVDITAVTNGVEADPQQVTVAIPNDDLAPPAPNDDSAVTTQNAPISIPVLANDATADGAMDVDTLSIVTLPQHGTAIVQEFAATFATVDAEGLTHFKPHIAYQPQAGFVGTDTLTYSIRNQAGISATATLTITVEAPVAPQAPGLFSGANNYPLAYDVYHLNTVILQDCTGDAIPDLIGVSGSGIHQISVMPGRGDGTFSEPLYSTISEGFPTTAAAGDFNGDGKLDLLISLNPSIPGPFTLELMLGRGDGTFATSNVFAAQSFPTSMIARDVDGDGKLDAVIVAAGPAVDGSSSRISVFLGRGNGTFQTPVTIVTETRIHSLVAEDFDHDGKLDLAVSIDNSYPENGSVRVWSGVGNGTFQQPVDYALNAMLFAPLSLTNNNSLTSGDFNGDGFLDLAASTVYSGEGNAANYTVDVLFGTVSGSFAPAVRYLDFPAYPERTEADSFPLTAGDFNHDGISDLAIGGIASENINVAMGNADGSAPVVRSYGNSSGTVALAVGDLNGDGKADLVSANEGLYFSVFIAATEGRFSQSLRIEHALGKDSLEQVLSPFQVIAGDVNGDQHPDLVLSSSHLVATILSNGDGTFQAPQQTPVPIFAISGMAVADVNGDHIPDLVGSFAGFSEGGLGITYSGGALGILIGVGDGTYSGIQVLAASDEAPGRLIAADFNADGIADIATTSLNNGAVYIRLGVGDGTFAAPDAFVVGMSPMDIALDDFDKDGNLDLVAATLGGAIGAGEQNIEGGATVLFGNGDGTFRTMSLVDFSGFVRATSVATADFNNDGLPDVVVNRNRLGAAFANGLSVWLNNGDGTFGQPIDTVSPQGNDLQTGDFNHDGIADVIVVSTGTGTLVLIGNGDGTFRSPIYYGGETSYGQVAALADFSGDGIPDLALPWGRYQIEVLQGAIPSVTPNRPPVAVADLSTAIEAGGLFNGAPGTSASGNVLANDTDPDAGDTKTVSAIKFGATTGTVGAVLTGSYGELTIAANGTFTYTIDNSNTTVESLRISSMTLLETFQYTIRDSHGTTASSTLTITITGANDAPIAVTDAASAVAASGVPGEPAGSNPIGNVLSNDTDIDSGDTKSVSAARFGSVTGTIGVALAGDFGSLILNADGAYQYVVDNADLAVKALLNTSNSLVDIFEYTVRDTAGATSSSTLTVTLTGTSVTQSTILTLGDVGVNWIKKRAPVIVLPQITVTGSASIAGGTLTLNANTIGTKKKLLDQFSILSFSGLGSSTGPRVTNGHLTLEIQLNGNATNGALQSFLRSITFATKGKGLKTATRTIGVTLAVDGSSSSISQTINILKRG